LFSKYFWGIAKPVPYSKIPNNVAVSTEEAGAEGVPLQNMGNGASTNRDALNVIGLYKSFGNVNAVRNLNMTARAGELLALLGHNGAGKTTTINILTGLANASAGNAFIFGYSVKHDMDYIRTLLGCCPQFDVYWPDLTAREHLHIMCTLKPRISTRSVVDQVNEKLVDVRLSKVADQPVSTFSGGMRRRLSMALSTIGDPPVIILDEPTTGVDPANRNYIWRMIGNLKKNKLVILTTHGMEEADALGDKIAIMASGNLKCIGTSLHLKNQYGGGYRINVVVDEDFATTTKARVSDLLPGIQVVTENAGNIVFSLPENYEEQQLTTMFEYLKNPEANVKYWGVSNTTLEDVFLKVTRQDHIDQLAEAEAQRRAMNSNAESD